MWDFEKKNPIRDRMGVLLADEMGLGKSLQALMYAHQHGFGPILIICPASLKWNWKREAWKHVRLRSQVLEGRTPPKYWSRTAPCVIINYDILKKWLPLLRKQKFQIVIVDECHKIGNPRTKQTKNVKAICKGIRRRILISGTPLTNRPAELFPSLNILRKDVFSSFYTFAERHCAPRLGRWGWEYKGATHLKELHKLLKRTLMIRRLKKDVLKDLPAKSRTVVALDIKNRKEYEFAEKDFMRWLGKKSKALAIRVKKAERMAKMGYLKRLAAELKLAAVFEWIDNFLAESDEKLVIFGVHRKILKAIRDRYPRIHVHVDGSVTGRKRQEAIDRFNKNPKYRLFTGNIDAAGQGWSCTSSSVTLFIELAWVPGKHTQAEDRTHGLMRGMEGSISRAYYLIAKDTIEEDLCKILQYKQKILDKTLDGGRGDELDIFDMLEDMMANRKKRRAA